MLLLLSCVRPDESNSAKFNEEAKTYFLTNLDSFNLSALNDEEKCILTKTIENDLNGLNDWKLTMVKDNLEVRSYTDHYTNLNFAFVKDHSQNKMHFVNCLNLWSMIFTPEREYYAEKSDSLFLNGEPRIIKIAIPTLDTLFNKKEFQIDPNDDRDMYLKTQLAKNFLVELDFTFLGNRCSPHDLDDYAVKSLENGSMKEDLYQEVRKLARKDFVQTHYFDFAGYLAVVFSRSNYSRDRTSAQLGVELFWIPFPRRGKVGWGIDRITNYCVGM